MSRALSLTLATIAALLCSACVIAPERSNQPDTAQLQIMSDQAIKTCGAGNVKEVNAKSFSCK